MEKVSKKNRLMASVPDRRITIEIFEYPLTSRRIYRRLG
jgi:hypothetical protein